MKKETIKITEERYVAPEVYARELRSRKVLCTSGATMEEEEDNNDWEE